MLIVNRFEYPDGVMYRTECIKFEPGKIEFNDYKSEWRKHNELKKNYEILTGNYLELAFDCGRLLWDLHDYETASFWQRLKYLFTKKL